MNWRFWEKPEATDPEFRVDTCRTVLRLEGYRDGYKTEIEDRAEVIRLSDMLVLVVADGAGGISGGGRASTLAVRLLREKVMGSRSSEEPSVWTEWLSEVDTQLANDREAGETTTVVVSVSARGVMGASVGDSEAWIVRADDYDVLTGRQERKPFLGRGMAYPVAFEARLGHGALLVASDGLFKYADPERICRVVREMDVEAAAEALIDLVRLPSGTLQDDIAVLLCRA